MDKKRIAVDFEKASPEVLKAIKEKYPNGVDSGLIKFTKGDQTYYAISVETTDAIYLVKIKKNTKSGGYDDDDYEDPAEDSEFGDAGPDGAEDEEEEEEKPKAKPKARSEDEEDYDDDEEDDDEEDEKDDY